MKAVETEVRSKAKELFDNGEIDLFIGYGKATIPLKSRPLFITKESMETDAGGSEAIVWDSFCSNNLAAYLQKYFENQPNRRKKRETPYPKIGLMAKGCDMRSVVALVKENQVIRENMVILGLPCTGMIDRRKVLEALDGQEVAEYKETGTSLEVTTRDGKNQTFDREEYLQPACKECKYPVPEGTDFMMSGDGRKPGDGGYARIKEFEQKSSDERWAYFESELSKCIRCNACRQACPTCWCKECFADHTDLKWIGVGTDPSDSMIFQIIRVFHQAGRCVDCDACYNACPMGIDLRTYTKKIGKDVKELFDFVPDFNPETTPPLSTFSEQDSDSFISDPDEH